MARHAAPTTPRRTLLRAGLTLTAAGAALGLGTAGAQAAAPAAPLPLSGTDKPLLDAAELPIAGQAVGTALGHSAAGALGPVKSLQLDPLAGTGTDPLDNALGTQIADFKPISTAAVTGPVTDGGALKDLPLVGDVVALLPG
ncbi:hypothetical protein [Streptomyces corynorhini]|uniref:ATP-binding protein n=1 Tax=Streptomyces corynorhini TaxID=2282652 RepID=A0A370AT97_9ACTN|nr:hypothetical protein [Streptomyces corynorhini]RDG32837.1 hypothetical protein DVH02_31965 [Streptomyces corynorhini]